MMNFGYNPYYIPPYTPQMQRLQNLEQQYPQFAQQPQQSYPQNPQDFIHKKPDFWLKNFFFASPQLCYHVLSNERNSERIALTVYRQGVF